MRYIGCKRRLLPFIDQTLREQNIKGKTFCDLFSGTASVGQYFKQQGYQIISNDLLYCSYVQQQAKIALNAMPEFKKLALYLGFKKSSAQAVYAKQVIAYLNQLAGIENHVYQHYSPGGTKHAATQRMYYTDENAKKIDAIRVCIDTWQQANLINQAEFYLLLYALLEAASKYDNTTGKQMGFLKSFQPNALRSLELALPTITASQYQHQVYHEDGTKLITQLPEVDILYLDPPYTRQQYASNYHLLESIARWDKPSVKGVTGVRDYSRLKSDFCCKRLALASLEKIVANSKCRYLVLSYSNESLITKQQLAGMLRRYGHLTVREQLLNRYTSLPVQQMQRVGQVTERLYLLEPFRHTAVNECSIYTKNHG